MATSTDAVYSRDRQTRGQNLRVQHPKGFPTKIYPTLGTSRNLSRSIFVPFNALSWIFRVISEALGNQPINHPKWRNTHTESGFASAISSNARGRFLRITELLPDGRVVTICIPEGNRSSGWALIKYNLHRLCGNFISLPRSAFNLPSLTSAKGHQKSLKKQAYPKPIPITTGKSHHQLSPAKNRNQGPRDVTH